MTRQVSHPGDIVRRRGFGDTAVVPPIPIHHVFSIVLLGQIGVVSPAGETDSVWVLVASTAERIVVVEFESSPLGAASTLLVHESALVAVALAYRTPHRRGDIL